MSLFLKNVCFEAQILIETAQNKDIKWQMSNIEPCNKFSAYENFSELPDFTWTKDVKDSRLALQLIFARQKWIL